MPGLRTLLILVVVAVASGALLLPTVASALDPSDGTGRVGIDHNGGAPDINAGPAITVAAGNTVDVPVVLEVTEPGACCWAIDLQYNPAILSPESCVVPDPPYPAGCNIAFGPDIVRGAGIIGSEPAITSATVIMTITFRAIGSAGQCTALTPNAAELFDNSPDLLPMASTPTNGAVCIEGPTCADFNGNGRVDLRDVARLLLHILLRRPYNADLDVNGDGVLNFADLAAAGRQLGTTC